MRLNLANLSLIGFALSLSACSSGYEPDIQRSEIEGGSIYSSLPSLTETVVTKIDSKLYSCLGRGADATFNQADGGDFSLSLIAVGTSSQGDQASNTQSSNEDEMSGRTPGVLMARELFFRTCEFSKNYQLSKDEALDLYKKTLDTVSQGWVAEVAKTTITIGETSTVNDTNTTSSTSSESEAQTSTDTASDQQSTTPASVLTTATDSGS
jgi:hypothetical protein